MSRRSEASIQKALLKKSVSKPFGPWECRPVSPFHHQRPTSINWQSVCYLNNRYSVQLSDEDTPWGEVVHLWIRRHDEKMPRSWSDLQRIKNELVGEDRVAVEVFPKEKELVDQANMAHLWVLPLGFVLPFSLKGQVPS